MIDLIGWLVHILVLLLACAGAMGLVAWPLTLILDRLSGRREAREDARQVARVKSNLHLLDRWCAYDFPIMEDVHDYLMSKMDNEPSETIDDFRKRMREKYGVRSSDLKSSGTTG